MDAQSIREFRRIMRLLERALDEQLQQGVQCCGVSMVQCHTLMELEKKAETNLTELSAALGLDKSTVSRGIEVLVKNGLADRQVDGQNRRAVILTLTDKGRMACDSINGFCDQYYLDIFSRIAPELHETVTRGLTEFARALTEVKRVLKVNCADFICSPEKEEEKED